MVDGLARVMCMRGEVSGGNDDSRPEVGGPEGNHSRHSSKSERKKVKCPRMDYNKFQAPVYDYRDGTPTQRSSQANQNHGSTPDYSPLHTQALENDIKEIKRILKTFITRIHEKDAQGKVAKEWRIVARVLDRLFFFMYLCTIIVSLATIFPKA